MSASVRRLDQIAGREMRVGRHDVHRVEDGTALDAQRVQGLDRRVARDREALAQAHRVHPEHVATGVGDKRLDHPIAQARKLFLVPAHHPLAGGQVMLDPLQLRQAYRRLDIGHAVVEADDREPVAAVRVHALAAIEPHGLGQFVVVRGDHPAFAGSDDLVAEEAEGGAVAEAARHPALVGRPHSLGGVLDDHQAVLFRDLQDRIHVGHLTVQVDRHDRLGARGDLGLDQGRIDVEGARVVVDQHHGRAAIGHRVAGGDVGEAGDDHLVARADAHGDKG
jgi:hypothetical protein